MEYHQKGGMFLVDAKGFSFWQPEGAAGKKAAPAKAAGKGGKKAKPQPPAAEKKSLKFTGKKDSSINSPAPGAEPCT